MHRKLLFLVKKVTISERRSEILRKFVFPNKFEKENIQKKIWTFYKQPFLFKAIKRDNIKKNCFSQLTKPHTAKPWFPVVLKHFRGNSLKIFHLGQKNYISERSSEIKRKFVFLNKCVKEQIQRKIRICCKQPFLFKAVKLDKYNKKKRFSPQTELHTATLCFSVGLKHFGGNSLKTSLFSQKSDYLRKKLRKT